MKDLQGVAQREVEHAISDQQTADGSRGRTKRRILYETMRRSSGPVVFAVALSCAFDSRGCYRPLSFRLQLVPAAIVDRTIRKGRRARFFIKNLSGLADFGKQELTVFDSARRACATIPLSQ